MKSPVPGTAAAELAESHRATELQLAVVTAAADLVEQWLESLPAARRLTAAAERVVLEVTLSPTQGLALQVVRPDGTRRALVTTEYRAATFH